MNDRGVADILEMLHVQAALTDAEQERVSSLADWRSARLQLLANVGVIGRKDFRGKNEANSGAIEELQK